MRVPRVPRRLSAAAWGVRGSVGWYSFAVARRCPGSPLAGGGLGLAGQALGLARSDGSGLLLCRDLKQTSLF